MSRIKEERRKVILKPSQRGVPVEVTASLGNRLFSLAVLPWNLRRNTIIGAGEKLGSDREGGAWVGESKRDSADDEKRAPDNDERRGTRNGKSVVFSSFPPLEIQEKGQFRCRGETSTAHGGSVYMPGGDASEQEEVRHRHGGNSKEKVEAVVPPKLSRSYAQVVSSGPGKGFTDGRAPSLGAAAAPMKPDATTSASGAPSSASDEYSSMTP
ncbi:hypothetical protein U1Q18_021933 [Sarracenia purpurea var. burkii]